MIYYAIIMICFIEYYSIVDLKMSQFLATFPKMIQDIQFEITLSTVCIIFPVKVKVRIL